MVETLVGHYLPRRNLDTRDVASGDFLDQYKEQVANQVFRSAMCE